MTLARVDIEQVVKLVEYDQFDATVFEQPGGAVGQTLHRAAAPGGITQGQEQVGRDAFGASIGLQGDLQDRLTVGRVGLAGWMQAAVVVHDARLADARGAEDGAADRFPGLFAGLVAAFQQRHGFAESRMQDEQLVGVGDAFGGAPVTLSRAWKPIGAAVGMAAVPSVLESRRAGTRRSCRRRSTPESAFGRAR